MLAFKTFQTNLTGTFQTSFKYSRSLWMPKQPAQICRSGYHVANKFANLRNFLPGPKFRIFLVEGRGATDTAPNKVCFEEIKLVRELDLRKPILVAGAKIIGDIPISKDKERIFSDICYSIQYNKLPKKKIKQLAKLFDLTPYLLKRSLNVVLKKRKAEKQKSS